MTRKPLTDVKVTIKVSADGKSTYEEIEPLVPLSAKVKLGPTGIDGAMLAAAEAAAAEMAVEFPAWAATDVQRMRAAAAELRVAEFPEAVQPIITVAHDLKGQGGSFGYPLVTLVAGSLCRLLERRTRFEPKTLAAIDAHLDALGVILAQRLSGPQVDMVQRLGAQLDGLVSHLAA